MSSYFGIHTRGKLFIGENAKEKEERTDGFRYGGKQTQLFGLCSRLSLRLQPICNCLGLIFLKITCSCLARERTAVSVRFIRMPIALELSPVSANLRRLSSSACVHGRDSKWAGSVIGLIAFWVIADTRFDLPRAIDATFC
jgi:hypothetical protein